MAAKTEEARAIFRGKESDASQHEHHDSGEAPRSLVLLG